ncbi:hypothetical protein [Plantactinospora mayteni]|uniref:hypothetical protein n=1 Tax=Plantactinospora mayteni TaxID=566021 RepID=UPI0019424892|nr:hypothetical protein [Plantactinospora mayteni]
MLTSDSTSARWEVFDHYCSAHRHTRFGGPQEPFSERVEQAVRRCARQELASAIGARPDPTATRNSSPNRVSALYALWFCARPADGPLVARVLDAELGGDRDPEVFSFGVNVAGGLLGSGARRSIIDQLVHTLTRVAVDPRIDVRLRGQALRELGNGTTRQTVTSLLSSALASPDLTISSTAALALLGRKARFTNQIRRLAATWPTGPTGPGVPWEVSEVRYALAEEHDRRLAATSKP